MTEFKRKIVFRPAFDKRHSNPKKNYGIGSMTILFGLTGKKGAVTIQFSTDIFLPETVKDYLKDGVNNQPAPVNLRFPEGAKKMLDSLSIDYHSKKPMYEGQAIYGKCIWMDDEECYCDGSCTRAEPYADVLLREGSDAIWKILEKEYKAQFRKR